jgi:hypothetical protein
MQASLNASHNTRGSPCSPRRAFAWLCGWMVAGLGGGCGSSVAPAPAPKECNAECQDKITVRATRELLKLAFNLTLQGKPVGAQNEQAVCPLGGFVRVTGEATANAQQGSTNVNLEYEFFDCVYESKDDDLEENYRVTLSGLVGQRGVIAVQPSSTTALQMRSQAVTLSGTVYNPAIPVELTACTMQLQQDGNELTGTLCERKVGLRL